MDAERHNPAAAPQTEPPRPGWLDLLHREAAGELSPAEHDLLRAVPDQAGVDRWRRALGAVTQSLGALPPPPLPGSVAAATASEVAWSARLESAPSRLPHSVAGTVVSDIAASRALHDTRPPPLPRSLAAQVAGEVRAAHLLTAPPRPLPRSVAAAVAAEVSASVPEGKSGWTPGAGPVREAEASTASWPLPGGVAGLNVAGLNADTTVPRHNPAPLVLVLALMVGLTLLAVTTVWPNLAAGALVLRTLLAQVSPLAGVGLGLLLLTSAAVSWRPGPVMQRAGAGAFALSAVLTLPALYAVAAHGDVRFGQNITVSGPVDGNVIAVGGHIQLEAGARVRGEVVTLLGDVRRAPGAQVSGRVNALLGHAPDDLDALETSPPQGIALATAAAFRPLLGWLGSAAWPQVFVTLTGGALLLLFVAGLAPTLASRQRHAPMRTLALGVLALAALSGPALALALSGLLGPALVAAALTAVLIAVGLSVSAYDVGRSVAHRLRLPVPDAVGALLGLSAVAASLGEPPLAFALSLIGGAWGAGTLLLARGGTRTS